LGAFLIKISRKNFKKFQKFKKISEISKNFKNFKIIAPFQQFFDENITASLRFILILDPKLE